jgi:hypothetical protein
VPFAILPTIIQPFGIGNHTDSVYIPATFRNSEEQIWSSERRRVLFECLEHLTTGENIRFDLTSIIFRVVLKDQHGEKLAEDILIRLAFRREDCESGKKFNTIRLRKKGQKKEIQFNTIRVGENEVQCKQSRNFVQKWIRKNIIAADDWLVENYGYSYTYKEEADWKEKNPKASLFPEVRFELILDNHVMQFLLLVLLFFKLTFDTETFLY